MFVCFCLSKELYWVFELRASSSHTTHFNREAMSPAPILLSSQVMPLIPSNPCLLAHTSTHGGSQPFFRGPTQHCPALLDLKNHVKRKDQELWASPESHWTLFSGRGLGNCFQALSIATILKISSLCVQQVLSFWIRLSRL